MIELELRKNNTKRKFIIQQDKVNVYSGNTHLGLVEMQTTEEKLNLLNVLSSNIGAEILKLNIGEGSN